MINPPFNFTGSKFKLLEQLLPNLDYTKSNFIDLFCGGGSVYANVVDKYEKVWINDKIEDLIKIHKLLVSDTEIFVNNVKKLCPNKDELDKYLQLRIDYNSDKSPEKLYALMLCSHNNLMRFNKSFQFNQHFGKRTFNNKTEEKINLFVSHLKNHINKIYYTSKEFYDCIPNDFTKTMIYIDPPYFNSEAGYNAFWDKNLEIKLYDYIKTIDSNKGSFCLSGIMGNHKGEKQSEVITKLINDGYKVIEFDYNYNKVAKNKESEQGKEIIIKNY